MHLNSCIVIGVVETQKALERELSLVKTANSNWTGFHCYDKGRALKD